MKKSEEADAAKNEDISFEAVIARLDEIVRSMERGDLPLEEAITLFEEGTKLSFKAEKLLETAEQLVKKLARGEDGVVTEVPFDASPN